MLAQYIIGFFSGLLFLIPVLYGINDLEAIQNSTLLFPLGDIYLQVTGSPAGSIGLLLLVFLPVCLGSVIGCYLTVSRMFWTLARDNATPFSLVFGNINPRTKVPTNAIILVAVLCTILGCIYIGNATAFSAFVSSFVVLTMASYTAAILPHLLSGRSRIRPGSFWMGGAIGYVANTVSCIFMLVFIVVFCFPFAMPVTKAYMNYTCVLLGGFTLICGIFYMFLRKDYEGPKVIQMEGAPEMAVKDLRAKDSDNS
jgi:choline transport protein